MKWAIATVLGSSLLVWACSQPSPQTPSSNNPNGQSELAGVMRTLQTYSVEVQTALKEGKPIPAYPEAAKQLITAQETEGMIASRDVFNGFAQHYLLTLDSLYSAPAEHHVRIYNNTVNSCVQCHGEYCMGPIPAIKKLYVQMPATGLPTN